MALSYSGQYPTNLKVEKTQIVCNCPTCGAASQLTYVGDQTWPPHVAQKLQMPVKVHLWRCETCKTTLTW